MSATGLVIDGGLVQVPGLTIQNFYDDPSFRLRIPNDGGPAHKRKVAVVVHSTHGTPGGDDQRPQKVLPGAGVPGQAAEANIHYWTRSDANAGAHLLVDFDGTVICTADLVREITWHAESVNDVTISIEMVQGLHGKSTKPYTLQDYAYFYERQLVVLVLLVDAITRHPKIRIQQQVQSPYHGSAHPVPRLHAGGSDCVGVYMHRDQTSGRGPGDAGNCILEAFLKAGYEPVDFATNTDLAMWKPRQLALNALGAVLKVDGVAGLATADAIQKYRGHPDGIWRQPV